jgi:hypothetical protein
MSKKIKTKSGISLPDNPLKKLKKETHHSILAIIFFVLAILTILASFDLFGRVGENLFGALVASNVVGDASMDKGGVPGSDTA